MTDQEDIFDDAVSAMLDLDMDDVRELRIAIMDLNYEELYKPLFYRHEEFVRKTKRNYLILIVLLSISLALDIGRWLW